LRKLVNVDLGKSEHESKWSENYPHGVAYFTGFIVTP